MNRHIRVKVIPKAKQAGVFEEADFLKVKVHSPAEKGKANKEVITLLADYFAVSKSSVILIDGETSPIKVFRIISS